MWTQVCKRVWSAQIKTDLYLDWKLPKKKEFLARSLLWVFKDLSNKQTDCRYVNFKPPRSYNLDAIDMKISDKNNLGSSRFILTFNNFKHSPD